MTWVTVVAVIFFSSDCSLGWGENATSTDHPDPHVYLDRLVKLQLFAAQVIP